MKKTIKLIISILFVIALLGGGLYYYYFTPSNFFILDINPSIKFEVNRLNNVTSVTGINEEAKELLNGYTITDPNLEVVIEDIVNRMILNNYISADLENDILVTTNNNQASIDLSNDVNEVISNYLSEKKIMVVQFQQTVETSNKEVDEAIENGISVGKQTIIEKIEENEPDGDNNNNDDGDRNSSNIKELIDEAEDNNTELDLNNYNEGELGDQNNNDNDDGDQNNNDNDDSDQNNNDNDDGDQNNNE